MIPWRPVPYFLFLSYVLPPSAGSLGLSAAVWSFLLWRLSPRAVLALGAFSGLFLSIHSSTPALPLLQRDTCWRNITALAEEFEQNTNTCSPGLSPDSTPPGVFVRLSRPVTCKSHLSRSRDGPVVSSSTIINISTCRVLPASRLDSIDGFCPLMSSYTHAFHSKAPQNKIRRRHLCNRAVIQFLFYCSVAQLFNHCCQNSKDQENQGPRTGESPIGFHFASIVLISPSAHGFGLPLSFIWRSLFPRPKWPFHLFFLFWTCHSVCLPSFASIRVLSSFSDSSLCFVCPFTFALLFEACYPVLPHERRTRLPVRVLHFTFRSLSSHLSLSFFQHESPTILQQLILYSFSILFFHPRPSFNRFDFLPSLHTFFSSLPLVQPPSHAFRTLSSIYTEASSPTSKPPPIVEILLRVVLPLGDNCLTRAELTGSLNRNTPQAFCFTNGNQQSHWEKGQDILSPEVREGTQSSS